MQNSVDSKVSAFKKQLSDALVIKFGERETQSIVRIVVEDLLIPLYIAENENIGLGLPLQDLFLSIHQQLMEDVPVQYIVKKAWFFGMSFEVSPACLIPRPETEELVEWCLLELPKSSDSSILDIGTGSGCIPITLKKKRPNLNVTAFDISENALEIARKNALNHKVHIDFQKIDFLKLKEYPSTFDYIISNPPYIPFKEKEKMDQSVWKYEPSVALFVENENPLIFYQKIADFSQSQLSEQGKIFLECNEYNATDVSLLFLKAGFKTILKKDMFGKQRMLMATRK